MVKHVSGCMVSCFHFEKFEAGLANYRAMVTQKNAEPEKNPASASRGPAKAAAPKSAKKRPRWRRFLLFVFLLVAIVAAFAAWIGYPVFSGKLDTLIALFDKDQQTMSTISASFTQAEKRIEALELNLSETKKLSTTNAEEIQIINEEAERQLERSGALDARLQRLKNRIDRLGRKTGMLVDLEHHVSNLESQISSLHQQITFSTQSPTGQLFLLNEALHYLDEIPRSGAGQGAANVSLHTAISLLNKLAPSFISSSGKSLTVEISGLQDEQYRNTAAALQRLDTVLENGWPKNSHGQDTGTGSAGKDKQSFWQELQQTLSETIAAVVTIKRLTGNQQQLSGVTVNSLLLARSALLSDDLILWRQGLDNALLSLRSAGMEQTEAYADLASIRNISLAADLARVDRIYALVQILRDNLENGHSI